MQRRAFMRGAVAAAGLSVASKRSWAQSKAVDAKRARIALMMFGLNSIVKTNMPPAPERTLELMDIGEFAADTFGIHTVSVQSNYFPSTAMSWIRDFKARLAKSNTRLAQINVELGAGLNMGTEPPSTRLSMVDLHGLWIDRAALLDCPRILLNQGQPTQENKALTIENYKSVVARAKARGITCASENRNAAGARGVAPGATLPSPAPPAYLLLAEILQASGTSTCVDFLNFPNQDEQLAGIRHLLPMSSGLLHVGIRYDLAPAMKVCREQGYRGLYAVKAIGLPGSPVANTQTIVGQLLELM